MLSFLLPPPAIVIPKPPELIRPGDPRFVVPQVAGGVIPFIRAKPSAAALTFTFQASASTTADTITIPATAAAGDWAICFDVGFGGSTPTEVVPTGFTQIGTSLSGANGRSVISYKTLVGGDPNSSVGVMTGSGTAAVMLVFRPSQAIATVTPSTWNGEYTSGNPTSQTVTVGSSPLIVFGNATSSSAVTGWATESPAFDSSLGANSSNLAGYKIYDASPSNHTIDMADFGTANILRSGYVAFT